MYLPFTALTVAVTEAAVEYAKVQPCGRLRVPMRGRQRQRLRERRVRRDFLSMLSDLVGVHWVDSAQISSSAQSWSVSTSRASQQRPIATVADLQALPAGRAWVFASGTTAVLAHLVPWRERDKESKGA